MSRRTLINAAICLAFCANFALPLNAASLGDPFSTGELVNPPPGIALAGGDDFKPCPALAPKSLSLADVVNATLCGNPQTREVWANARAQASTVGRADAAYLPKIDAVIDASRNHNSGGGLPSNTNQNQRNKELSLSWLLYDFGGRAAGLTNAEELLNAANATQDATVQSLFLAAVQAFYQLQSNQAIEATTRAAEKAALESFNAAEARYKTGVATPADKLQAQTAWSQATLNRIKAAGDVNTAQGLLANVMGLNAATPLQLATQDLQLATQDELPAPAQFSAKVEQLIDEAMRRRPDLRAAAAQARAALAGVDSARATGRPSLSLGAKAGETSTNRLPDANSATLGLTLSIPLYAGFDTTYKIRAAEAQADARQAQQERVRLQVTLDVWNGYQTLTTAAQTIRATADLIDSAEQSQRAALGRYKAGVGNIIDLLNAQSALASAAQQRAQALYSWNTARIALAQAMGTLDRGLIDSLQEKTTP